MDRAPSLPTNSEAYDVVVFDGVEEQPAKARGVLTLGRAGAVSPVVEQGSEKGPRFVSSEKKPLMEGVDLNGVYIESGKRVKPKATAEVLAQSSAGPLVVASRSAGKRQVYVSFEPLQSDFPLQVSFPIFISNCLDYLGGQESATMLAVKAGSPFSIASMNKGLLEDPNGNQITVDPAGGNLVVRAIRQVGKHALTVDGKTKPVYAYLRSDRESNIEPGRDITLAGGQVKAQQAPVRFADFWRPLILLALLVLAGEWWLYARRS